MLAVRKKRRHGGQVRGTASKERPDRRARGGGVEHSDRAADAAMIKSAIRQHETEMHGGKHDPIKLADGGRVKGFHPGGEKGKLHREIGVPVGEKIPAGKLEAAAHSPDPEKRRDAIRAKTMKKWHHGG